METMEKNLTDRRTRVETQLKEKDDKVALFKKKRFTMDDPTIPYQEFIPLTDHAVRK